VERVITLGRGNRAMENEELGKKVSQYFFFVLTVMLGILAILSIVDFFLSLGVSSLDIIESHILLDQILYSIILVELVHLTITYTLEVVIDPRELILIILTAVGRKLIVKDLFLEPAVNTFAAAIVLLFCIYALKILPAGHVKAE
jgi:uncharacterized membrane protein (DUF373 family)